MRLVRLLRWSEKYTKTDMVYLAHGGFWLICGHAFQIMSGLVLAIAFANLLSKETYGTYQFIMAGATVLGAFTLTGMSTALNRAVARGEDGALRAGFRAQLRWSLGIVLSGAALALYYFINGNNTLALSFLIAGSFAPFIEAFGLAQSYLYGKELFKESVLLGFGRRLLPVLSLIVTIFLTHNPVILILVYFASNTVAAGLAYRLVITRYHLPHSGEGDIVSYSKHLSVLRTISDLAGQADKVLVWMFLGAAPLAAYALAQFPVTHIQSITRLMRPLTFARLNQSSFPELKETLPRKVRVFFAAVAGGVAVYILAAPWIFSLLFPAYPESVLVSQLLVLTVLATPRTMYWQALAAHQKKREMYLISISQSVIKVVLLLIGIPVWGMWGAIAALLLAHIYDSIIIRIVFKRAQ